MSDNVRIALIMQGGRAWAGGSEYIKNIVLALASLPPETQSTFTVKLICSKAIESELLKPLTPFLESIHYLEDQKPFTIPNRLLWKAQRILFRSESSRFETFLDSLGVDFVYPHFAASPKQHSYRSCPWIPDFQHKYLPDFFSLEEILQRDRAFSRMSELSNTVVVSSETAKSDFYKFFPNSKSKVEVLRFKTVLPKKYYSEDSVVIQHKYNLPDRFFIVSNQFWKHKNHIAVLEALKLLHKQSITPILVCTGHMYDYRHPQHSDEILEAVHTYGLARQIYILGMIPRADQIQLMRKAIAVIQPSLFEGWSTVVEDARCLGKTILLSDIPVHLEQHPPNSFVFDRHSVSEMADIIAKNWEVLLPGPILHLEAQAKQKSAIESQSFGERFIEIACCVKA